MHIFAGIHFTMLQWSNIIHKPHVATINTQGMEIIATAKTRNQTRTETQTSTTCTLHTCPPPSAQAGRFTRLQVKGNWAARFSTDTRIRRSEKHAGGRGRLR